MIPNQLGDGQDSEADMEPPEILCFPRTAPVLGIEQFKPFGCFKMELDHESALVFSVRMALRLSSISSLEVHSEFRPYLTQQHVFPFLDLPPELRNEVYNVWISQWTEASELVLRDHRYHGTKRTSIWNPCWVPSLCLVNQQIWRETIAIFLRQINFVAHDTDDLEWLHNTMVGFQERDRKESAQVFGLPKDVAYRCIQRLTLPYFFRHSENSYQCQGLQLSLLDKCTFITHLTIGINTVSVTSNITFEGRYPMRLRELNTLDKNLDSLGIPHVFTLRYLKHIKIDCLDDDFVFRNTVDEPLRGAVSLGVWLQEGFCLRLRDHVGVDLSVRGGRFDEAGEAIPAGIQPMDEPGTVSSLPQLETVVRRHWGFLGEWQRRSRLEIVSKLSALLYRSDHLPALRTCTRDDTFWLNSDCGKRL